MILRSPAVEPPHRRDLAAGAALAFLLVGANTLVVSSQLGFRHKATAVLEWDHRFYIAMARPQEERAALREAHLSPYCYRVLTPLVVERLTRTGLSLHTAFYLVTNLSLAAFLTSLYWFLRLRRLDRAEACLGVTLVGLLPGAVRWYEYQYWMTDPLCLFLVVLAFIAVELEADTALVGVCVLGALARETIVIVLPYAVLRRFEMRGSAAALRLGAVLWPPVLVVLLALRHAIELAHVPTGLLETARGILAERSQDPLNQLYLLTLGSFGVLLPMLWLAPGAALRRSILRPSSVSVIAIAYASLVLGNNTDRLLAYAVPVVVPFALTQLRSLSERTGLRWSVLAALVFVLQLHFFWLTPFFGVRGLSAHQPTQAWIVAEMAAFFVAAAAILNRRTAA